MRIKVIPPLSKQRDNDECMDTSFLPVSPYHLLTAKMRFAVTVMMAGDARPGWVLAAMWVTGELDGNFSTMITSCCICSVNISGVCRRRYCSGPPDGQRDEGKRGKKEPTYGAADKEQIKKDERSSRSRC